MKCDCLLKNPNLLQYEWIAKTKRNTSKRRTRSSIYICTYRRVSTISPFIFLVKSATHTNTRNARESKLMDCWRSNSKNFLASEKIPRLDFYFFFSSLLFSAQFTSVCAFVSIIHSDNSDHFICLPPIGLSLFALPRMSLDHEMSSHVFIVCFEIVCYALSSISQCPSFRIGLSTLPKYGDNYSIKFWLDTNFYPHFYW